MKPAATKKVVCHLGKFKRHQLTGMQIHNQREKESRTNPDIDKSKSHLNYDLHNDKPIKYLQAAKEKIEKEAPNARLRKDSVYLVEAEISAGKSFWQSASKEEQDRFFKEAYSFLSDRYGKKNVVYAAVHNDEATPHMHFGFVPITKDGKLNVQKAVMNRPEMAKIHKDLFEHLKEKGFDVEKGVPAKEKHVQPQRFKYEEGKKKLLEVSTHLKQTEKALESKIEGLRGISNQVQWIDDIEVKEKGLFSKDKVELKKSDWQKVKNQAKQAVALKIDLDQVREDFKITKHQNELLKGDREKARKYDRLGDLFGKEKLEEVLEVDRQQHVKQRTKEFDRER